ncbi:hypothetical protein ACIA2T_34235 [Amycolatopsis japonica]|uniref:hypothetical protein n=1 Tax=Amycolatopsis japonica TaxID=208439 RepID=UPI0037BDAFB9
MELGKEIARDLSDYDVLGRWMAHHLADLIGKAEAATGEGKITLQREAAEMILRLWAGRSRVPLESRPTASFQPVVDALTRLSEDKPWSFYGLFAEGSEPDATTTRTSLLRWALSLEQAVRDVVRHIVVAAAEEATDKEAKWVRATEHLAEDESTQLVRWMRRLKRLESARSDDSAGELNEETYDRNADMIATLRKAEARLVEARLALEQHAEDQCNTGRSI